MICPKCGGKISVVQTIQNKETNETYRRKKCMFCRYLFYTIEYEIEHDEHIKKELNNLFNKNNR